MSEQNEQSANAKQASTADTLKWVRRVFRKHWPFLVASIILSTAAALFYAKSQPKVYEAASLLEFDPDTIRPLGNKQDILTN